MQVAPDALEEDAALVTIMYKWRTYPRLLLYLLGFAFACLCTIASLQTHTPRPKSTCSGKTDVCMQQLVSGHSL